MDTKKYIEELNDELERGQIIPPTKKSVVEAFDKYISNKAFLKEVVSMGMLYYSYNVFTHRIVGTCFEQCLDTYIATFHKLFPLNKDKAITAINSFIPSISDGYRSITELNLISNTDVDESRMDLFSRFYIKGIGDTIECALKPHIMFLDNIYSIVYQRKSISKSLGDSISYLSEKDDSLKKCYKTIFDNVQISQWRNIADHNDYKVLNGDKVEIEYGSAIRIKKIISRDDLVDIAKKLDTLIYLHKIAFTLISYDNYPALYPGLNAASSLMHPLTLKDNIISQLVETTYAYGYKLIDMDENDKYKTIFIETKESSNLDKWFFEKYMRQIVQFVGSNFELQMFSSCKKMIYRAILENRELKIFHFIS